MASGRRAKLGFALVWGLLGGGALFGQSFRQGGEFQVNRATVNNQYDPSVAVEADGDFVVIWTDAILDGGGKGIFGLRFNSAGSILGNQFQINTYTRTSSTARSWRRRATATSSWYGKATGRPSPPPTRSSASDSRPRALRWGSSSR